MAGYGLQEEFNLFENTANRKPSEKKHVSFAEYKAYVEKVTRNAPNLRRKVLALASALPSEANVERGFSSLEFMLGDLRNLTSTERVESIMIAASCYRFLTRDPDSYSVPKGAAPARRARTESAVSEASPPPVEPVVVDEDPVAVQDSDSDSGAVEDLEIPAVDVTFKTFEFVFQSEFKGHAGDGAPPPPPVSNPGRLTRQAADKCHGYQCERLCKDHPTRDGDTVSAYFLCSGSTSCRKRLSCAHAVEIMVLLPDGAPIKTHTKLERNWVCDECDGSD